MKQSVHTASSRPHSPSGGVPAACHLYQLISTAASARAAWPSHPRRKREEGDLARRRLDADTRDGAVARSLRDGRAATKTWAARSQGWCATHRSRQRGTATRRSWDSSRAAWRAAWRAAQELSLLSRLGLLRPMCFARDWLRVRGALSRGFDPHPQSC